MTADLEERPRLLIVAGPNGSDHLHVRPSPLERAKARDPIWDQQSFQDERDAT